MSETMFFTADEVAKQLGISKPMAYKIIRKMNEELAKKGIITIAGKVSKQYVSEKIYGMKGA